MARYLPFLISLALTIYALFSCIQTRDEDVPYLPKLVWILLIVFVPFAGPIVWLLMVRYYDRQQVAVTRPAPKRTSSRPLAPDDDPDFLASLEPFRDPRLSNHPAADDKPERPGPPTAPGTPTTPAAKAEPEPAPEPDPADSETPVDDAKPDEGPRG
ncbi:PLD nuclease N-terminal domain-containing protein [Kribbella monticola]|uniref:PLD nuclease N-terminal domain-containing protein n=1 Tax=Kribbella monticola TaxID=2185285 RepID=UPI000DD3391A|nr:PLD nuclease N-terminal domain-containing protein [Kribbella monticola]